MSNKYLFYEGGINSSCFFWRFLSKIQEKDGNILSLRLTSDRGFFTSFVLAEFKNVNIPSFDSSMGERKVDKIINLYESVESKKIIKVYFIDDREEDYKIFEKKYSNYNDLAIANWIYNLDKIDSLNSNPCIALLDILWPAYDKGKPGSFAMKILDKLLRKEPEIPVFMISIRPWFDEIPEKILEFWKKGAWGFIYKNDLYGKQADLLEIIKTFSDIDTSEIVASIRINEEGKLTDTLTKVIESFARENILIREVITLTEKKEFIIVGYRNNLRDINVMREEYEIFNDSKEVKIYRKEVFDRINLERIEGRLE